MKRLVVLALFAAALSTLGAIACGGGDKPPMTPDTEPKVDVPEGGAPATPSSAAPAN